MYVGTPIAIIYCKRLQPPMLLLNIRWKVFRVIWGWRSCNTEVQFKIALLPRARSLKTLRADVRNHLKIKSRCIPCLSVHSVLANGLRVCSYTCTFNRIVLKIEKVPELNGMRWDVAILVLLIAHHLLPFTTAVCAAFVAFHQFFCVK